MTVFTMTLNPVAEWRYRFALRSYEAAALDGDKEAIANL